MLPLGSKQVTDSDEVVAGVFEAAADVLRSTVDEYRAIVATFLDHVVHRTVTLEGLNHTRTVLHQHVYTLISPDKICSKLYILRT